MKRILALISLLVLLLPTIVLKAQTPPVATIVPFSEAGVTFQKYDPAISPNLAELAAANPDAARLLPYAGILTNATNKRITAVTVLWCPSGTPARTAPGDCLTLIQDGLYIVQQAVAEPGSKILITPANLWREESLGNGYISVSTTALRGQAEFLEANPGGRVELDVVIFDDGLIIGPDQSETVAGIKARKAAAEAVSKATLEALDRGEDPASRLEAFVRRPGRPRTPTLRWSDSMVRMILRSPDRRVPAQQLSRIPDISNLHRAQ